MKFLEIRIYSIMPSEPLPRVGAALGSGYTDNTASLGQGANSLGCVGGGRDGPAGAGSKAEHRGCTHSICLEERGGSLEKPPREEPLRSSGSWRNST